MEQHREPDSENPGGDMNKLLLVPAVLLEAVAVNNAGLMGVSLAEGERLYAALYGGSAAGLALCGLAFAYYAARQGSRSQIQASTNHSEQNQERPVELDK